MSQATPEPPNVERDVVRDSGAAKGDGATSPETSNANERPVVSSLMVATWGGVFTVLFFWGLPVVAVLSGMSIRPMMLLEVTVMGMLTSWSSIASLGAVRILYLLATRTRRERGEWAWWFAALLGPFLVLVFLIVIAEVFGPGFSP